MRSVLIALLLAGAATPVVAADANFQRRDRDRSESRDEARPERPRRDVEHARENREPAEHRAGPRRQQSFDGGPSAADQGQQRSGDTVRNWRRQQLSTPVAEPQHEVESRVVRPPRNLDGRDVQREGGDVARHLRTRGGNGEATAGGIEERNLRRAPGRAGGGGLVEQTRPLPRVLDRRERRVSRTPVLGTEPPAPRTAGTRRATPEHRWRTDWRHDRRYDWRNWRRRHRSHFHFGFYSDPFGWDYFRYGVGWRLWPSYYGSSFWLRDPWQYRLPPAYGPYRWVRYYNDALLVNIYTGQVVDVEYNFFW